MAREKRDRLERLTNLMLVLLHAERPLTLREISSQVEGYPEGKASARQAFERDKRALRGLGIPVTTTPVTSAEQVGYLIRPDDYYLPDLDLDEEEAQALAFAVAAVQLGGDAGRDALSALGQAALPGGGSPVAVLPSAPALARAHEALKSSSLLRLRYHGREREVEPYGLAFKGAAWYLVARDRSAGERGAGAVRTFRVDRIEGTPVPGEAHAFEVPAGFDLTAEIRLLPFPADRGEGLSVATLAVDARMSRQVAAITPQSASVTWDERGGALIELAVGDERAFVSFVAGLGDTAVVQAPEQLRRSVVEYLSAFEGPTPGEEPAESSSGGPGATPPAGAGRERGAGSRGEAGGLAGRREPPRQLFAGERLRRLLAVLVHLAKVGEAEIPELGRRFGMDEAELVHDLELAACCGLPPYTPDQLIELVIDGERVTAFGLGQLARPRRLTPEEGFALAAAGRALCDVPGSGEDGALRSALAKLEGVLGRTRFSLALEEPVHLAALREAAREHESVEIEYVSSASPVASSRRIDPYQVVLREGRWYVDAWCHRSRGPRRFQLDRVQAVTATGEVFEPRREVEELLSRPGAFLGGPSTTEVVIAVPAGSEHGVEDVAAAPLEQLADGRVAARLRVADVEGWFGRLLLRLGPESEVLEPPELAGVGRAAARRALEAYGSTGARGAVSEAQGDKDGSPAG